MTSNETDLREQTTSDGIITVERTFEVKDSGAVSTVVVRAEGNNAAVFRLFDSVPDDVKVTDSGFKEGFEPMEGTADKTGVAMESIVRPGEPETFVYAYALADPDSAGQFQAPTIEKSIRLDDGDEEGERGGEMPFVRGASPDAEGQGADTTVETPGQLDASYGFLGQIRKTFLGEDPSTEGAVTEGKPIRGMQFGANRSPNEGDDESASNRDSEDEEEEETGSSTPLNSLFSDIDSANTVAEVRDDQSLVAALTKEIQRGEVSTEEIETLGEELRMHRSSSTDVRMSYLQSRLDRFAAYTDALEELIDTHGTGTEIVDGLLDRISDLRSDLEGIAEELEVTQSHRIDNQIWLSELEERSDQIDAEVDGLRDDLDQQESLHQSQIEDLTDRIDRQQTELTAEIEHVADDLNKLQSEMTDDLETFETALRSDIEALRHEVERNSELRRRMVEIAEASGGLSDQQESDALRSRIDDATDDPDSTDSNSDPDSSESGSYNSMD